MAKSSATTKPSLRKNIANAKNSEATPMLARPPKTQLKRKGMTPQKLFEAAGSISVKMLDEMEKAINESCGRVEPHGE